MSVYYWKEINFYTIAEFLLDINATSNWVEEIVFVFLSDVNAARNSWWVEVFVFVYFQISMLCEQLGEGNCICDSFRYQFVFVFVHFQMSMLQVKLGGGI